MPSREPASAVPRVNILGVGVSSVNMQEAVQRSEELLRTAGRRYVCVTGVHGIMESQRDPELRAIHNRAFLCLPDGMPTVWLGRLQGHPGMARVYGPDFMLEMCRSSARCGYRHFLYGGKPGIDQQLREQLEQHIPGIVICGTLSPPFRPLTSAEEEALIATINDSAADIVWVGLSTPKQELFMARMSGRLNARLMVGVGAAFDIHAGLLKDAPTWMKRCGLQWLYRLCQEPRRLGPRYLINNPSFLWTIGLQLCGTRTFMLDTGVFDSEVSAD